MALQPVKYGAFLHLDAEHYILSFSPELFFRLGGKRLATRPMKGTAPRGRNNEEDAHIADWLRKDAKNCSENLMIVDLLQNDMGRVCEFGSVKVEELFRVEKYSTLFQMVSTISGQARRGVSHLELFRSLFPCGSVTGAPKIRTMEIIRELEERKRGVYTGAIGYFAPNGEAVFNVAIRTLVVDENRGQMGWARES